MTTAPTNGAISLTEWDAEAFRVLREAVNRPALEDLDVLGPGLPKVTLDFSGMQELIATGVLDNAVLSAVEKTTMDAVADMATDPENAAYWRDLGAAVDRQHDLILSAIVIAPKYYALDQLPRGNRPPDGICVWDFTPEMRWAILAVLRQGADELARFRPDPAGYAADLARDRSAPTPEQPDSPEGAVAPPVLAGRDAASAATAAGNGRAGGSGDAGAVHAAPAQPAGAAGRAARSR